MRNGSTAFVPPEPDDDEIDSLESNVPLVLQNNRTLSCRPHQLPIRSIQESGHVQESHSNPIYCASWSKDLSQSKGEVQGQSVSRYLATCAVNCVTLYRVVFDGSDPHKVKSNDFIQTQTHKSDDKEESYYACAFAGRSIGCEGNPKSTPQLLCVGGAKGVIDVIDLVEKKFRMRLLGHGYSILSLKPCPMDESILLSSSEDESIRIWNLRSGAPVAILKGREGHLDSVVCADWNIDATFIVSGGMDTTIKVWDVREGSQLRKAMLRSHEIIDFFESEGTIIHEKLLYVNQPLFSTQRVHMHCVDCVQFIPNGLILSKSVDSRIELWEPIFDGPEHATLRMKNESYVQHLHTFEYEKGEVWYMNFATDPQFQRLAVGDCDGYVYVWTIGQKSSAPIHTLPTHGKLHIPVRGVTFSPCGNTLVAFRDDGSFCKWDLYQ